ncbi:MAG TPA: serine--tRNA ligase, partial [Burkholderiales bacterium]|nr:serine--tRNA ligase [Burkholderiales bacterium]
MLDPKYVLENLDFVKNRLETRGQPVDLSSFVRASAEKRDTLRELENLRAEKNKASEEISRMKKAGTDPSSRILEMRKVGDRLSGLEESLKALEEGIRQTLLNIPNVPHESVPAGSGSADNKEVRRWGRAPDYGFEPQAHWDIGEGLGILDFGRAA